MPEIPASRATGLEKKFSRYVGIIVLVFIFIVFVLWVRCLLPHQPAVTATLVTGVISHFDHERYSGPVTVTQNAWMQCPAIDPTRQKISIHIDEMTVWIDWVIDGKFYREKPKYFLDHQDIVVCNGSSFMCRVTPGTAVPTATAHVTITDYP